MAIAIATLKIGETPDGLKLFSICRKLRCLRSTTMLPSSSAWRRRNSLLFKTIVAFRDLLNYHKADDGMWKAEFHGALDVAAEGPTLEECRSRAVDQFDEKLSVWIIGSANSATPRPDDE